MLRGKNVRDAANELATVMNTIRSYGDTFTPQAAEILMHLVVRPGLTMAELADLTGLTHASISRNLDALGSRHRAGQPGLGMVRTEHDPREGRRHIAFPTAKGMLAATLLTSAEPRVLQPA